jgi:CelD/BcsL family acetyltransferase involved in cellulose biosynthesis
MLTPAIAIDGPFDCWFGTRSKNLRHNLRRQARRLAESGVAVEIRCLTAPKQMAEAVALYAGLEACGWKSKAGTAVTPGSRQERFYRQLLEHFAKGGEAQVWQILFDGVLAASDLCLSSAGITIILKTAYNEALADKHTSPAQILRRDMFETLFGAPGARRIEFFGPLKPWHRSWTDEQRQLYHLNHYRFAPIAYFHALAGRLRKKRKRADAADTEGG